MLENYLKVTFRNLWKTKGYASINIMGLAVGMTSFLVILLYLNHELSYDRWHQDLDKVYKVSLRKGEDILKTTQSPLAALLRDNIPQIETATAISTDASFEMPLNANGNAITQTGTISADSLFFKVFPYPLIAGDAVNPLQKPNAMVISEEVAKKLFGAENPIGKTVKLYNSYDYEVTAVMQHPTAPTHLDLHIIYRGPGEKDNYHWQNYSFLTYVKTSHPMKPDELGAVVDRLYYKERLSEENKMSYEEFKQLGRQEGLFVDAVHAIHNFPKHGHSNIGTVSILLLLATLLLVAGAINFSNLSIATSLRRVKEVGVKKVLGSSRGQLFWQFIGEISIQCFLALAISILLLNVALPYFNHEFQVSLSIFKTEYALRLVGQITLCLLLVIALSGLYPAVLLSRHNASKILKGDYSTGKKGLMLRNSLIVVQFMVAAFFIYGVVIVTQQLDHMQQYDKGLSGEQVIRIQPFLQGTREDNFDVVKRDLLQIPGVQSVSKTTRVPGDEVSDTTTTAFKSKGEFFRMTSVKVSADYFETLGVELLSGRTFNDSYADQHTRSAVINETAAKEIGILSAGETFISYPNCDSIPIRVVGIVKDFNVLGLERKIQPSVFTIGNEACVFQSGGAILVKLTGDDIRGPVAAIEKKWKTVEPNFPIRLSFLDDNFQQLFLSQLRLQRIVTFFGFTAISISLMGLFALTAFLVGQRAKEISIRKVLGADVADLGLLLSKDFLRLITLAVLIAIPLGWWSADQWLQGFAYRISLNGWMFVLTAIGLLVVAALTVSMHTLKAARMNVAERLRDE